MRPCAANNLPTPNNNRRQTPDRESRLDDRGRQLRGRKMGHDRERTDLAGVVLGHVPRIVRLNVAAQGADNKRRAGRSVGIRHPARRQHRAQQHRRKGERGGKRAESGSHGLPDSTAEPEISPNWKITQVTFRRTACLPGTTSRAYGTSTAAPVRAPVRRSESAWLASASE
jgi:hypothetical protein